MRRKHGTRELIFDTIDDVTDLVRRAEDAAWSRALRRFVPPVEPVRSVAGGVAAARGLQARVVYGSIRAVSRGVRLAAALGMDAYHRRRDPEGTSPDGDATRARRADEAEGALNGAIGHMLAERGNPLAITMGVRVNGQAVPPDPEALAAAFPEATGRVVVFVHGLSATEWSWRLGGERFHGDPDSTLAARLAADTDLTPVFVRYNSGLRISDNGQALADLLEAVCAAWPVPVEQVALVGHSMGGLVSRSAAHHAEQHGLAWTTSLSHLFCLGTPHLGAPLEKVADVVQTLLSKIDAGGAQVPAEVMDMRSDGIKDLRFGYITEAEWRSEDPDALLDDRRQPIPLPEGVTCWALAATLTRDPDHPLGQLVGDWMVRTGSGTGVASDERHVPFESAEVIGGVGHVPLVNHPQVEAVVREALGIEAG